jgi:hypothetical protein
MLWIAAAFAAFPLAPFPDCGPEAETDPTVCPDDLDQEWNLISYVPAAWQENLRPEELGMGTGLWADRAWSVTVGQPEVLIAVLDSGIKWDERDLLNKHYLNAAELPVPEGAEVHDANGDGVFNLADYVDDSRVDITAGQDAADHLLDPSDLIATFSDGVDDDANGYIDDISGWDIFRDDNDPYDDTRYGHGTGEAKDSGSEGDNGMGQVGTCPNCMILNVRVGDSFVADVQDFAAGAMFAVDSGASVIQEALGTLNDSTHAQRAIDYAWDNGVIVIASAADEASFHANLPGVSGRTVYVNAVRYDTDDREDAQSFLGLSGCTNHGARMVVSAPSTSCSSGATGILSGVAGLVYSAALEEGVTLTAGQVHQILKLSADDIVLEGNDRYYPSVEGWDRYSGYGRVNAYEAVLMVKEGRIPAEGEITSPDWFHVGTGQMEVAGVASGPWVLHRGQGDEPEGWVEVASGPAGDFTASFDAIEFAPKGLPVWPQEWDEVDREDALNTYAWTLRLTIEGDIPGEDRRVVYGIDDPDLSEGFPMDFGGASLDASPNLVDLNGDGALDIVIADGDGWVHAFSGGAELPGWPVSFEELRMSTNHADADSWQALGPANASTMAHVAAGDLDGDGSIEVVAATLSGGLWVFGADGSVREGFPVFHPAVGDTDPDHLYDDGWFSSPALGDIDEDGQLEIVIGGMDQHLYVFNADGTDTDGWPVRLSFPGYEDLGTRIVSSPALGDLDGDGDLELVIGTNETLNGTYGPVYALQGDGTVMDGWPVALFGAYTNALPVVGEGIPGSPALADFDGDGDVEVAAHTIAGNVSVFDHDGTVLWETVSTMDNFGKYSNTDGVAGFPFINSPSWGDVNGDGTPDLFTGAVGSGLLNAIIKDGQRWRIDHLLLGWDGASGDALVGFPRVMEDMQFFVNPAIADIDGDKTVEVLHASGGFVVHAFDRFGNEPDGWPKFTGHWMTGSPAVGDVDGDGLLEVVIGTRAGWLFVWDTPAIAGATVEWAGWGHDSQNTRNHSAPLPGYNGGYPDEVVNGRCAGCGGGVGGFWLFGLLVLARRRGDPN